MEYNTQRAQLLLPEYGRNVQNMIAHAHEIENREERNLAAKAIIEVMGQLNPHLRDEDDYRHKLWTHLFIMSGFQLDVDSPYELPNIEILYEKPKHMEYPSTKIKFGHYGKYTEKILNKVSEESDKDTKEYLTGTMANFMKKQFLTYNNDAVENNVIALQLAELTNGKLTLDNPENLIHTNQILKSIGAQPNRKKQNPSSKNNQNNKFKFKKKY